MMLTKNLMRVLFCLLFLQACAQEDPPAPEDACYFQQNSYLQRVSWAWKTPIVMYTDTSVNEEQKNALIKAMGIWNDVFARETFRRDLVFQYGGALTRAVGFVQDRKNVVSFTSNWPGKNVEQAETIIYWQDDKIIESDMRINATKNYSVNDNGTPGAYDLVALYVHELGHVLGLLHIETEDYTAMAIRLAANDVNRRTVGDLEIDALGCEY